MFGVLIALVAIAVYSTGVWLPTEFPDRMQANRFPHLLSENETAASFPWTSKWFTLDGADRVIHLTNEKRVQYFDARLQAYPRPGRFKQILDIGCGDGSIALELGKLGYSVTGLDRYAPHLQTAKYIAQEKDAKSLRFLSGDATNLPFLNSTFDGVVMGDILEHIPDLYTALTEAARVLKPGGSLVLSTMNRTPQTFCLQGLFQKFLPGYPTAGPASLDQWRMYVTPEEISKGVQAASMELMESDLSLLWPSIDFRKLISNKDSSFIGTFWALHAPFGVGSKFLARFGPYMAWARKTLEVSGEQEVSHWFPAGVQNEDGSISMPTEEEIEAYSVEYDGT